MLVPALSIDRSSARHLSLSACAMLLLAACNAHDSAQPARRFGQVDERRLAQADREPQNWFTKGRDRNETFFSPLARINDRTATQLGLAWEYQTQTARGLEATPIVVDGVMYVSGNWGRVYALDARTGAELLDVQSRSRWHVRPAVVLRRRQSRRCRLAGQGFRWLARRLPVRARCRKRQGRLESRHARRSRQALYDHRRAAGGRRTSWSSATAAPSSASAATSRLRSRERQVALALLHGARRPEAAAVEHPELAAAP